MRRLVLAGVVGALLSLATAGPALADYGTFTNDEGLSCTYSGSGRNYDIHCSGYSIRAGRYVSYNCDYYFYGGGSASWSCRDLNGNTWRGSR